MYPELYSSTHPVWDSRMFFGYQEERDDILKKISTRPVGKSFLVLTSRKMGKTSLLLEIQRKLKERLKSPVNSIVSIPVYLSLQQLASITQASIYKGIIGEVKELISQPDIPDIFRRDISSIPDNLLERCSEETAFDNFRKVLEKIVKDTFLRIVILLDEVECLANKDWASTFCGNFRFLLSESKWKEHIALVMTETAGVFSIPHVGSPLKNVLDIKRLYLFSEDESKALINQPTNGALNEEVVEEIVRQTGGHPFLIQYIMENLRDMFGLKEVSKKKVTSIVNKFQSERNDFNEWFDGRFREQSNSVYSMIVKSDTPVTRKELIEKFDNDRVLVDNTMDVLLGCIREVKHSTDEVRYEAKGEMFKKWYLEGEGAGKPPEIEISDRQPCLDKFSSSLFEYLIRKQLDSNSEVVDVHWVEGYLLFDNWENKTFKEAEKNFREKICTSLNNIFKEAGVGNILVSKKGRIGYREFRLPKEQYGWNNIISAHNLIKKAASLLKDGQLEEALKIGNQALQTDQKSIDVYLLISEIYKKQNRELEAREVYETCYNKVISKWIEKYAKAIVLIDVNEGWEKEGDWIENYQQNINDEVNKMKSRFQDLKKIIQKWNMNVGDSQVKTILSLINAKKWEELLEFDFFPELVKANLPVVQKVIKEYKISQQLLEEILIGILKDKKTISRVIWYEEYPIIKAYFTLMLKRKIAELIKKDKTPRAVSILPNKRPDKGIEDKLDWYAMSQNDERMESPEDQWIEEIESEGED